MVLRGRAKALQGPAYKIILSNNSSTHVCVAVWYDYDSTYELVGFYAFVAKTSQNVQHRPSQFCCAADTIACNPHSNDIQRSGRAAHTRMEGTAVHATGRQMGSWVLRD